MQLQLVHILLTEEALQPAPSVRPLGHVAECHGLRSDSSNRFGMGASTYHGLRSDPWGHLGRMNQSNSMAAAWPPTGLTKESKAEGRHFRYTWAVPQEIFPYSSGTQEPSTARPCKPPAERTREVDNQSHGRQDISAPTTSLEGLTARESRERRQFSSITRKHD